MITLKTLGKTTWKDIKIGEVFAWEGCWGIVIKISEDDSFGLAETHDFCINVGESTSSFRLLGGLYKLPKSIQALWKEE